MMPNAKFESYWPPFRPELESFMGVHNREYKGITYAIDTDEKRGRWYWSYALGDRMYELQDRSCSSEAQAVSEAEGDARWRIDQGAGR